MRQHLTFTLQASKYASCGIIYPYHTTVKILDIMRQSTQSCMSGVPKMNGSVMQYAAINDGSHSPPCIYYDPSKVSRRENM